jgi:hypothetical protein
MSRAGEQEMAVDWTLSKVVGVLAVVVASWPSAPVAAQDRVMSLDYAAPEGCPDGPTLAAQLAARLGYPVVREGATRAARVRVFADGPGHAAMVELDAAAPQSFRSAHCVDVVAMVARALTDAIDRPVVPAVPTIVAPAPVGPQPGQPTGARVRLEADVPELQLHRLASQHTAVIATSRGSAFGHAWSFDPICTAPCETRIEPGTHRLAISRGTGGPALLPAMTRIDGDSLLTLRYTSRTTERVAGWLTFGVGVAGGLAMTGAGFWMMLMSDYDYDTGVRTNEDSDAGLALLIAGGSIALVSGVVGMIFAFLSDVPELDVQPLRF